MAWVSKGQFSILTNFPNDFNDSIRVLDGFGIILGSLLHHFFNNFKIILGSFWDHFWDHFGFIL